MKTASYILEEEQIDWVKTQAKESGNTSGSAVVRKVLADAMQKHVVVAKGRDGYFAGGSIIRQVLLVQEQVSSN